MHLDACLFEEFGHCKPENHDNADVSLEWWQKRHRWRDDCLKRLPCSDQIWPDLYSLVRTLVSSPSLARLVHRLHLSGSVPRSIWTHPEHTGLPLDDLDLIKSTLRPDAQISSAGWLRRLENGCPHAFAALLLTCLPNLHSLHLGPRFQDSLLMLGLPLLSTILRLVQTASVGIFTETVFMGSGRAPLAQSDNFSQLLLLRLPDIRSLALNLPRPLAPLFWSDMFHGPLTTGLETLELSFTYLEEHDFAPLLRACPRLRSLKYDYWTTPPSRDPYAVHASLYTPDRSSERLINTRALQQSLEIVSHTLETFHLQLVAPRDWYNQNLQSIDFSAFHFLTTLHVPFQPLVSKDSAGPLADKLPSSLKHLWLNDDASRLWLNHNYFWDPYDYDDEDGTNPVDDPLWHPVHTDQEIVHVMHDFLAQWRTSVPYLESLKFLFYPVSYPCWGPRDIPLLATVLESAGQEVGIKVSVTKVYEKPCCCQDDLDIAGQDPPYFTLDKIRESQWRETDNWNRNHITFIDTTL